MKLLEGTPEQDYSRASQVYQDLFDILVIGLHNDDHEVIFMRVNSDGVIVRESDDGIQASLLVFGYSWGYYVRSQDLHVVFPPKESRTSFVCESSPNGTNHEV